MKKTVMIAFVGALMMGVTSAGHARQKFVGVVGGATVMDFGSVNADSRWGGVAGLTAGVRTASWSVLNLEVAWTRRGSDGVRLDYIDIPVMIGAVGRSGRQGEFRGRFYTGIGVGFKVACQGSVALSCDAAKGTHWYWPSGLLFGRWSPDGTFVGLDVRYDWGLSDAFDASRAFNRGFQFRMLLGKAGGR